MQASQHKLFKIWHDFVNQGHINKSKHIRTNELQYVSHI